MSAEPDSATIAHDTAHVAEGLAQFYRRFKGLPALTAIASAWLAQVQQVEDALWALLTCTLDTAVGAQLDQIGAVLGFARGLLADKDYQAALRGVVLARRSSGRAEDIIAIARAVAQDTNLSYTEGSASQLVELHDTIDFDPSALLAVLLMGKSGGVQLQAKVPPSTETGLFAFASDPFHASTDASRGFADSIESTGGRLTGVYG